MTPVRWGISVPTMLGYAKYAAALVLVIAVSACVAACGKSEGDVVVVRVGHNTITQAALDHWIRVEAVTSHEAYPTKSVPKGQIPVPPNYTDCIAYLGKLAKGPKPTTVMLKRSCATEYAALKHQILELLITYYWIKGEGARQGLVVSDTEIVKYLHAQYPTQAALERFLRATGETPTEQRMLATRVLMGIKLQRRLAETMHTSLERATPKFATELAAGWAPQTSCRPGYVVPQCRQYRGPHT